MIAHWLRIFRRCLGLSVAASRRYRAVGKRRSASLTLEMLEGRLAPAVTLSLTPSSLPADTVNVAYNQTISSIGGSGAITLVVSNVQNAIAGLSVPSSASTSLSIGGTPTATGTETFTVTATDSLNNTAIGNYSITVNNGVPTLSNVGITSVEDLVNQATLTGDVTGPATQPFTLDVNWGDGSTPQTFTLPAGTTTFSESYTYQAAGIYTVSLSVGDSDYSNDLLYGSTGGAATGQLYLFDLGKNSETLVGSLPGPNVTEITANTSTGQDWLQYGSNQFKGQQFNINTGAAIGGAISDSPHENFNALTFIGSTLYAAGEGSTGGTSPSGLFILNPTTGTATLIGMTGINGPVSGIAYDPANSTLYGIEGGTGPTFNLVTLNLTTGAATTLFSTGFAAGSLSFGSDGQLYGGSNTGQLYNINVANQAVTPLSIAAVPSAVSGLTLGNDTAKLQTTVISALAISTATLPADTINVAYNETITASGGSGAITLAVSNIQNPVVGLILPSTGSNSLTIGGTPTATGTETFTVTATDAAGDTTTANYSVSVNKANQAINFTAPTSPITFAPNETITLNASASSGDTVVFSIDTSSSGSGSISNNVLTVTAAGTFVLDANQAGDSNYNAAPQVQQTLVVSQANQTITFTAPTTPITFAPNETVTLNASASSGDTVAFSIDTSSSGSGSISDNVLTVTSAGTFVLDANQAGDSNYNAAPQVQQTLVVNPAITLSPAALPADTIDVPYNQAFTASGADNAFYANQVVSYVQGTIPDAGYNNPSAALGGLNPVAGSFDGTNYYLTPFDPAFWLIGPGGSRRRRLADPQARGDRIDQWLYHRRPYGIRFAGRRLPERHKYQSGVLRQFVAASGGRPG